MSRFDRWVLTSVALLAIPGRHAVAQFNTISPGSTGQGDVLRGEGTYAFGWGMAVYGWGAGYHLWALGRLADAEAQSRLDAASSRAEAEYLRRRQSSIAWRKERIRVASDARQTRF